MVAKIENIKNVIWIGATVNVVEYMYIIWLGCYVALASEWLEKDKVEFFNRI